jgi:membrane protein implicated in regulation of membrane protease activity
MGDKLVAGIVTAIVIAPFCALCILGPTVSVSIFAGIAGWLGGLGPVLTASLVLVAGITVYARVRRRMARRTPITPGGKVGDER